MPLSSKKGDAVRLFALSTVLTAVMAVMGTLTEYVYLIVPYVHTEGDMLLDSLPFSDNSSLSCQYSTDPGGDFIMFKGDGLGKTDTKVSVSIEVPTATMIFVFAALALKILIYVLVLHKDTVYKNQGKQESNGFGSLFALSPDNAAHARNGRDWALLIKNESNFKKVAMGAAQNTTLADTRELCNGTALSEKELSAMMKKMAPHKNVDHKRLLDACDWIEQNSCKIQELDVHSNGLNGFALAGMLQYSKSIRKLDLSKNCVESGGGQYILMALEANTKATSDAVQLFSRARTAAGVTEVQQKCVAVVEKYDALVAQIGGLAVDAVMKSANDIVATAKNDSAKPQRAWAEDTISSLNLTRERMKTSKKTLLEKAAELDDAKPFLTAVADAAAAGERASAILRVIDAQTIHLKHLDFEENRLDLPTVMQLTRWGKQHNCTIKMSQTPVIDALFAGKGNNGVLDLHECFLSPSVNIGKWVEIAGFDCTSLNLAGNQLGNEATKLLSKWLSASKSNATLADLNLSDNAIDTSHHLVEILKRPNNGIKRLNLAGNGLKYVKDFTVVAVGESYSCTP